MGRFVHRFLSLYPNAKAWALDVVPVSSFGGERYLRARGLLARTTIGGQALLRDLPRGSVNIACNIHSWSEAPLASIEKWLDAIAHLEVRYLFFVPHTAAAVSLEADGGTKPIVPAVLERGYRIIAEQAKYGSSRFLAARVFYPYVHYYLFEKSVISEANPRRSKDLQTPRKKKLAGEKHSLDYAWCRYGPVGGTDSSMQTSYFVGWGGRIRTSVWRNQNPLPYHLATPHHGTY